MPIALLNLTRKIKKRSFSWTYKYDQHAFILLKKEKNEESVPDGGESWKVKIYLVDKNDKVKFFIDLRSIPEMESKEHILASCMLSLSNSKGDLLQQSCVLPDKNVITTGWMFRILIEKTILLPRLDDGILEIRADITTFPPLGIEFPSEKHRNLMSAILESENFSDFVLNVQGTHIPVHKCILSMHSPVFKAMLLNDTVESKLGRVDIEDIEPTTIRAMVEYIYTGKVSSPSVPLATKLLRAADKYDVSDLVSSCSNYLQQNLSASNTMDIFMSALDSNATELKERCLKFIKENRHDIELIDSLKARLGEGKDWALEILLKL